MVVNLRLLLVSICKQASRLQRDLPQDRKVPLKPISSGRWLGRLVAEWVEYLIERLPGRRRLRAFSRVWFRLLDQIRRCVYRFYIIAVVCVLADSPLLRWRLARLRCRDGGVGCRLAHNSWWSEWLHGLISITLRSSRRLFEVNMICYRAIREDVKSEDATRAHTSTRGHVQRVWAKFTCIQV